MGTRSRDGKVVVAKMDKVNKDNVQVMIDKHLDKDTTLCTDEATVYKDLKDCKQLTVNYSVKQSVDGLASTNGIESVWALSKQSYHRTFYHFSSEH